MQAGLATPPESIGILFNATSRLAPSVSTVLQRPRLLVLEPCAGRGALLLALAKERSKHGPIGQETIVLVCEQDPARMRELRAVVPQATRACDGLEVHLMQHDWLGALRAGRHADRTEEGLAAWRGVPLELRRRLVRRGWIMPNRGLDHAFDLTLLHPPWQVQRRAVRGQPAVKLRDEVWPLHLRVALEMTRVDGGVAAVLPVNWWLHPEAAEWVTLTARGFRLTTGADSTFGEHDLTWLIRQEAR